MTFTARYDIPQRVLYRNTPYFILCNNFNGTVDLYQELNDINWLGVHYVGVERAVEKTDLVML